MHVSKLTHRLIERLRARCPQAAAAAEAAQLAIGPWHLLPHRARCALGTLVSSSYTQAFTKMQCTQCMIAACLNLLYYIYKSRCHALFNAQLKKGLGQSYGDVIEQFWALLRPHAGVSTYMSDSHRHVFLQIVVSSAYYAQKHSCLRYVERNVLLCALLAL